MKGLRNIPRVLTINEVNGYKVSCLFKNGESRIIDFEDFFINKIKINKKHLAYKLSQNLEEFAKIKVIEHSIGWDTIGVHSTDFDGNPAFYPYELDPLVLYMNSVIDPKRSPQIGLKIRHERKEANMTQAQLAQKSGTTKHYISRLENNKSDIELLTLKKIVEAGLGKKLEINIV